MWNKSTKAAERGLFRALARALPPEPLPGPAVRVQSIVVFACTGIGGALFSSAAIGMLKSGYPGSRLAVIAHHRRMDVARHNPGADEVWAYSKSPFVRARLLRKSRKMRPDLVVALRLNEEAVSLAYLMNRHALWGSPRRCLSYSFLLTHAVEPPAGVHAVEEMLAIARAAGGSRESSGQMVYKVAPAERERVSRRFSDWFHQPYIVWQAGIGPNPGPRCWPDYRIIEAVTLLQGRTPHRVILTGSAADKDAAARIARACPQVIDLCAQTTLEETAAVVEGASVVVSRDTGVMHLAFAIGTPTLALLHKMDRVGIYGPPPGSTMHEVVHPTIPGESGRLTMADLPAGLVTEKILGLLSRRSGTGRC
jgi:heptosyltransferase-2